MLQLAHRKAKYPDFLQSHVQLKLSAADHQKADLAVYSGAHTAPVYVKDHQYPKNHQTNKLLLQYSLSHSDWQSNYTSEIHIQDVFCGTWLILFPLNPPIYHHELQYSLNRQNQFPQ